MKNLIFYFVILSCFFLSPSAQGQTLRACNQDSDYNCLNLESLRASAENGHAADQAALGLLYLEGEIITQDYKEAALWFHKSAEQGNDDGRFFVGTLHYLGKGVAQNYEEAYFWLILASISGQEDAIILRDTVAKLLTPEQISTIQKRAHAF